MFKRLQAIAVFFGFVKRPFRVQFFKGLVDQAGLANGDRNGVLLTGRRDEDLHPFPVGQGRRQYRLFGADGPMI